VAAGLDDVAEWAAAFQDKVRQIVERPACPGARKTARLTILPWSMISVPVDR
jgi:hypothetical protein